MKLHHGSREVFVSGLQVNEMEEFGMRGLSRVRTRNLTPSMQSLWAFSGLSQVEWTRNSQVTAGLPKKASR